MAYAGSYGSFDCPGSDTGNLSGNDTGFGPYPV